MYISCTDLSCHNWFPDFQLVRQNSFTTAYPMNCQHKLVWQLGFVHKIHIHLEATSPLFSNIIKISSRIGVMSYKMSSIVLKYFYSSLKNMIILFFSHLFKCVCVVWSRTSGINIRRYSTTTIDNRFI